MSDLVLDLFEDYLADFHAWGHEYFNEPLSYDAFEELNTELEEIGIAEDCGHITEELQRRRDEIERQTLTHQCYFADGPRIVVTTTR